MKKYFLVLAIFLALPTLSPSQDEAPLKLVQSIKLPGLKEGDFDHFAADRSGNRLFLTAEKNAAVEVLDLQTNKVIRTITGLEEPHSMLYRADLNKLFVVDGGAAEVKMYDGKSYKYLGAIKLEDDCDSSTYDPTTKYLYVVNGGKGAHQIDSLISIIDTTSAKKIADIKIDTDSVEAMALESAGPRLFANLTGLNSVGVFDRGKRTQLAKWSIADEAQKNGPLAFDEANHRLFVVTGKPGKLIILDSDSGRIVGSFPCVSLADEVAYDPGKRRIYIAGDEFIDVFQQQDADHYTLLGKIPGSFRAKTAILLPDMNRYYLAVPRRGTHEAEVRVYSVSQ
jgi:DNA-binding beta-propeller fold protein YncE